MRSDLPNMSVISFGVTYGFVFVECGGYWTESIFISISIVGFFDDCFRVEEEILFVSEFYQTNRWNNIQKDFARCNSTRAGTSCGHPCGFLPNLNFCSKLKFECFIFICPVTRFAWTPDDTEIVAWAKGKLVRINVSTGQIIEVPYEVDATLQLAETVRADYVRRLVFSRNSLRNVICRSLFLRGEIFWNVDTRYLCTHLPSSGSMTDILRPCRSA